MIIVFSECADYPEHWGFECHICGHTAEPFESMSEAQKASDSHFNIHDRGNK